MPFYSRSQTSPKMKKGPLNNGSCAKRFYFKNVYRFTVQWGMEILDKLYNCQVFLLVARLKFFPCVRLSVCRSVCLSVLQTSNDGTVICVCTAFWGFLVKKQTLNLKKIRRVCWYHTLTVKCFVIRHLVSRNISLINYHILINVSYMAAP